METHAGGAGVREGAIGGVGELVGERRRRKRSKSGGR
jgi:hypothetical protein